MLDAIRRWFPDSVTHTVPDGGLFLWCDLNDGTDTNRFIRTALTERVAFVPGYAFMVDIKAKQSSMRLNYSALPAEKITEGVRRLGDLLQKNNAGSV